jgi:hypothetical protein
MVADLCEEMKLTFPDRVGLVTTAWDRPTLVHVAETSEKRLQEYWDKNEWVRRSTVTDVMRFYNSHESALEILSKLLEGSGRQVLKDAGERNAQEVKKLREQERLAREIRDRLEEDLRQAQKRETSERIAKEGLMKAAAASERDKAKREYLLEQQLEALEKKMAEAEAIQRAETTGLREELKKALEQMTMERKARVALEKEMKGVLDLKVQSEAEKGEAIEALKQEMKEMREIMENRDKENEKKEAGTLESRKKTRNDMRIWRRYRGRRMKKNSWRKNWNSL